MVTTQLGTGRNVAIAHDTAVLRMVAIRVEPRMSSAWQVAGNSSHELNAFKICASSSAVAACTDTGPRALQAPATAKSAAARMAFQRVRVPGRHLIAVLGR